MVYQERDYRLKHRQEDLTHFSIIVKETDLDIGVRKERYNKEIVEIAQKSVIKYRGILEDYIKKDPGFLESLIPYPIVSDAPAIVAAMANAAMIAGVGPMAAVAGALSEMVGMELLKYSRDVIVENGGDIFLRSRRKRLIGIFAGQSVLSHRVGLEIQPHDTPVGICTSSGTVGHSLSFGCADAIVIVSPSAPLADAVATATGNKVHSQDDLEGAVDFAQSIPGVTGAIAILGDRLAVKGKIKLIPVS